MVMKKHVTATTTALFCILCLVGFFVVSASAEEYEALKGVKSIKTIFDFRDGNPDTALVHLQLVHDTYKNPAIRSVSEKPEFVVVFMDVSVLLLSKNRKNFSPEEKQKLEVFDKTISAMAKDGIRLEVCMFAAGTLEVDPESITPEIHRVGNGWIASLGYQQRGYSMVPVY
jgi:intracellular sulfur oxidation DsrE/DsrF family protein